MFGPLEMFGDWVLLADVALDLWVVMLPLFRTRKGVDVAGVAMHRKAIHSDTIFKDVIADILRTCLACRMYIPKTIYVYLCETGVIGI